MRDLDARAKHRRYKGERRGYFERGLEKMDLQCAAGFGTINNLHCYGLELQAWVKICGDVAICVKDFREDCKTTNKAIKKTDISKIRRTNEVYTEI